MSRQVVFAAYFIIDLGNPVSQDIAIIKTYHDDLVLAKEACDQVVDGVRPSSVQSSPFSLRRFRRLAVQSYLGMCWQKVFWRAARSENEDIALIGNEIELQATQPSDLPLSRTRGSRLWSLTLQL